jgi:hypothetical protein
MIAHDLGKSSAPASVAPHDPELVVMSFQQRLFETGRRLIAYARRFTLQVAETSLTRPRFRPIVARIDRLARHPK